MLGADPDQDLAENYRRFARSEVRGKSPLYEEICERVAADAEVLAFIERQPPAKRQPNLLLAAVRFLFGVPAGYEGFRAAVLDHDDEVAEVLATRRTQTNEPGRCAALLPVLCALQQPLALLEVGAAGGLCLLPDRYGYAYGDHRVGSDEVVFPCEPRGAVPLPGRLPEVVWRAGIDLNPIDLADDDAVRWLEALVWPEERDRLERLRLAIAVARRDPPRVVRGDLLDRLADVAAAAPRDATLVVFHTAVLAYLGREDRERFRDHAGRLDAEWISNEAPGVVTPAAAGGHFVIARGGCEPVAHCDPHGRWLRWL
jgi:hypothetical protein